MKRAFSIAAALLISFAVCGGTRADTLGKYLNDGSNVAWFIQISDTHIDSTGLVGWYPDALPWVLGECIDVVNPQFVINTGDLTDHTCGSLGNYLGKPCDEEWQEYRKILDDHGMTPDLYFDIPGNHDAYGEGTLDHYLAYSMQGKDTGTTQQSWRIDFAQQSLHFFSVATPGNDGAQWPVDNTEFTTAEIDEARGFLVANADAEFQMAFGHHDFTSAKKAADMQALFAQYNVNYYSHGHVHDLKITMDADNILRYRINTLGQSQRQNVAIWAVDNLAVTVNIYDAQSSWPKVVITAPADKEIDWNGVVVNPHIPAVPKSCTAAPVRALVFDPQTVMSAGFVIDSGAPTAMTPRKSNPFQWRGSFDATQLTAGKHTVTVSVTASGTATSTNEFYVEDGTCDLGPEDPDVAPTDGGTPDTGNTDAATADAGPPDAGASDGNIGPDDTGAGGDGGAVGDDAAAEDTGAAGDDGGAAQDDAGAKDAGTSKSDAGTPGNHDAGPIMKSDAGSDNAAEVAGCSCATVAP